MEHCTVLLHESIAALEIKADGYYLDCTFGRGGHSRLILKNLNQNGRLIALDRDPQAALSAAQISDSRFTFIRSPFSHLKNVCNGQKFDGVLFDLGVSSPQLDQAERGFSFAKSGKIDMRMDNENGLTALELLHQISEHELSVAIRDLGGEPHTVAQRIAKAIIQNLSQLETTTDLAITIANAVPRKFHKVNFNPATQTFQAIRMLVNDEVNELQQALVAATDSLNPQGILAVISFHSGEDAIVKRFMRSQEGEALPIEIPSHAMKKNQVLKMLGNGIRPSKEAIKDNPRCRSAILRRAIKS